jgi:formyl-CoA transferase
VVENYRPDVKFRLGIDYETLKKINPRLIYGSVSGFGQDGVYVNRPGVDQIAQGMGGLMSITGLPGQGPVRVGIAIADLAGGIFCAMGILIAPYERVTSGEGQRVQSSLLTSQISLLDFQATRWLIGREKPGQAGNDHPTLVPTGVFKTADGYINIAAGGQHMFERMCRALGLDALIADPRYADDKLRSDNRRPLNAAIEAYSSRHTSAEVLAALDAAEVPAGPIYSIDQVFEDPQVKHLGIVQRVAHPRLGALDLLGQPMTLSRTPSALRQASPDCGEHTDDILAELGYSAAEIAALHQQKAV